ncbi:Transcriptional regulator, IclR family [Rhodovulum sp. PH10]|uniref:IclR family transcriptional regulator n=1 Tax=Rhodovulum sp. PH10 TaxID=1187851 RepID=UPI00027C2683|nr:IclR family transcriptional regulator [Rhodovulum sp. PH10]EJW11354.1 Transcriptional regulator, IclR family [Rhodovulum sp. PH10]
MSTPARTPDLEAAASGGGILAIHRALQVIEILAEENGGLSLSEIARRLDVNKQVATRITESLEVAGFIFRHPASDQLFLSYRICNIGERMLHTSRLLEQCSAMLRALADASGELARLAVVENDALFWVLAAVSGKRMLQINPLYTPSIKLHGTATGKAWLATMPDARVREVVAEPKLKAWTKNTITDPDRLLEELAEVRKRGFAITLEESESGVSAVAAPIVIDDIDHRPRCVGIVSLAAPTHRMGREALIAAAPLVTDAAGRAARMWPITALEHVRAELSGSVRLEIL